MPSWFYSDSDTPAKQGTSENNITPPSENISGGSSSPRLSTGNQGMTKEDMMLPVLIQGNILL